MFLVDDDGPGPEDGGEVEQGEDTDGVPHDAAAPVVPQLQVVAPQRLVVLLHLQHTCRLELQTMVIRRYAKISQSRRRPLPGFKL